MDLSLSEWLQEKPFTLCLSSGYFGFYAHAGFVAALFDQGINPAGYSGSSAGALIAGCFASGMHPVDVKHRLLSLTRDQFWDPGVGLGLLKGKLFRQQLRGLLPVKKIEDCAYPLSVSTYAPLSRRTVVFKRGDLSEAVRASCAVPLMFQPVWIGRKPYLDGGIMDRAGMQGVEPGARVFYHHLLPSSWWRAPDGLSAQVPKRSNMATLSIKGLPSLNPFMLQLGVGAYDRAYFETKKALDLPLNRAMHLSVGTDA